MADTIELIPAPHTYFDEDGSAVPLPGDALLSKTERDSLLAITYAEGVTSYEEALDIGLRQRIHPPSDRFPSTTMRLPGGDVRVRFDPDLDRQLLRIYTVHGWSGVTAVEASLTLAAKARYRRHLYPWPVVQRFFLMTRNRLLLQIRSALIDLERYAADQVVYQLNEAANLVDGTLTLLRLEETTVGPNGREELLPSPSWDTPTNVKRTWRRIGNRRIARDLYSPVSRAVAALDAFREVQRRVDNLDAITRKYAAEGPLTETRQDLATAREQMSALGGSVEKRFEDVAKVLPMAVMVLPVLSGPFNQALMEHRLGEILEPLRKEPERLMRGISDNTGWLAALIPDWDGHTPLENLFSSEGGLLSGKATLDEAVITVALDKAAKSPAYLPILSERALDQVVAVDGPVQADSLTFVVWGHYKAALIAAVGEEQRREAESEAVLAGLSKVAAFLSLLLWFTPAGAIAKAIQVALGIGLLVYQTYSVVHTLSVLNRDIDSALIEVDRTDLRTLSRLSELQSMRQEYLAQIGSELMSELTLIVGAGAFTELKLLLHYRGYYYDLQTLVSG